MILLLYRDWWSHLLCNAQLTSSSTLWVCQSGISCEWRQSLLRMKGSCESDNMHSHTCSLVGGRTTHCKTKHEPSGLTTGQNLLTSWMTLSLSTKDLFHRVSWLWCDICIFNCNWVDTQWQRYITHIHTNNTHNTEKGKLGSAGRAPSLRVISWHLPYNWGKSMDKPRTMLMKSWLFTFQVCFLFFFILLVWNKSVILLH
jgi:hypothetical protein